MFKINHKTLTHAHEYRLLGASSKPKSCSDWKKCCFIHQTITLQVDATFE